MPHRRPLSTISAVAFAVLVFFSSCVAVADVGCDIQPILLPLHQNDTTTGVLLQLGTDHQNFNLRFSIIRNATVVATANACHKYYKSYGFQSEEPCVRAMGGVFNESESGDNIGVEEVVAKLPELDIELQGYEVVMLRGNSSLYESSGVGLGLNSTFIQQLYEAKHIPTRSYGIGYSYNQSSQSMDVDSLVLGGYDKSQVQGSLYDSKIGFDSLLEVEVERLTVTLPDGSSIDLLGSGDLPKTIKVTLDDSVNHLVFSSAVTDAYKKAVGAETYADTTMLNSPPPGAYGRLMFHSQWFGGNLTIKLSNGFEVTIPPELLSQHRVSTGSGMINMSTVLEPEKGAVRGVFGTIFLSQAYLSTDYENMKFSLAKRAENTNQSMVLEQLGCNALDVHVAQSSNNNSGSDKSKALLRPILGSLLGAIALLAIVLFLIKRIKKQRKSGRLRLDDSDARASLPYDQGLPSTAPPRSWREVEGPTRIEQEKGFGDASFPMPPTPSKVSLAPSRTGTPVRNSYFTEDLGDGRP